MLLRASAHLEGDRIVPHYFTAQDEPWLRVLIDEYAGFVGQKCSELHDRLAQPLSARAPKTKRRIAMLVLDALCRARPSAPVPPKEARAAVFRAAAAGLTPRVDVLRTVAESFAVTAVELESSLFADLRGERRVSELPPGLSPLRIASDANLAIIAALLRRAAHVRITVRGNSRALVRHARIVGLICRESRLGRAADGVVLDVSGPFTLFRHSEIYGRALASLVPRVLSSEEFEINATCALERGGHLPSLVVCSGEAIGMSHGPQYLERRIDQKFEHDFRRAAPEWELLREPPAIAAGESLIFPDFALMPVQDPTRRWLLEIVGFWTPEYLREKLARLRAAGIERFLLCIDQKRDCTQAELPADPRIIRYKTRLDARAVLALLTAERAL
jgi:predicted nuclease of restriction endonuclease-like RecB superfamily